jgi:glucose-1-phosphate thymidylyltransferase
MKGILLAGGSGTRLAPMTGVVSKQLLPVYDKPLLYYPLSLLLQAGIREILVISTPRDLPLMRNLLQNGSRFGVSFSYAVQEKPEGIAQAFLLAEDFLQKSPVCLVLGDNVFYGQSLASELNEAVKLEKGALIFGYHVQDPERYGVLAFDAEGKVSGIEEKPIRAPSPYAVTGLYFYDEKVVDFARQLTPSKRGELEITDLSKAYLERGLLNVRILGRGTAWLDTGTPDSLLQAAQFVQTIEQRQGLKIACLEEIAFGRGFITRNQLAQAVARYGKNDYGNYLARLLAEYDRAT